MGNIFLTFINDNFTSVIVMGTLVAIIKTARPYISELYKKINNWIDVKISTSKHNELFEVGKKIWFQVEEDYKVKQDIKEKFIDYLNYKKIIGHNIFCEGVRLN